MLQRLSIALAQVKAGNTSENLLNEIHIVYSFYRARKKNKNYTKIFLSYKKIIKICKDLFF